MEDESILDLYFARDEQAVVETDRKYGGYCFHLANSICKFRSNGVRISLRAVRVFRFKRCVPFG